MTTLLLKLVSQSPKVFLVSTSPPNVILSLDKYKNIDCAYHTLDVLQLFNRTAIEINVAVEAESYCGGLIEYFDRKHDEAEFLVSLDPNEETNYITECIQTGTSESDCERYR
jgi:hypothetical protein